MSVYLLLGRMIDARDGPVLPAEELDVVDAALGALEAGFVPPRVVAQQEGEPVGIHAELTTRAEVVPGQQKIKRSGVAAWTRHWRRRMRILVRRISRGMVGGSLVVVLGVKDILVKKRRKRDNKKDGFMVANMR